VSSPDGSTGAPFTVGSDDRPERRLRLLGKTLFGLVLLGFAFRVFLYSQNGLARSDLESGAALLTEELLARLDELRAAQKRLVTAQDTERKRLERNIHDRAQQQLVAMAINLKRAEQLLHRDVEKAQDALVQLRGEAGQALAAQGRRAAVSVEVAAALDRRYPPELEAAVYFSCLEGLQNVAKYAQSTRAQVRVRDDHDAIVFEVVDDGRGFDLSVNGFGTGLQGIADRLGALDGTLEVVSFPGRGTTICGRIPTALVHEEVSA
jgi:signal transduction histidine kinase